MQPEPRTILPSPQTHRYCRQGPAWLYWNVPQKVVHMQIPDMACTIRTDLITLSGVYQMEINRFDAATRFHPWTPYHQPNEGQKKSINKFLRYLQATWADLGRSPPEYQVTPTGRPPLGRYYCPQNSGSFPLRCCPRIVIPPGCTTTIIPDHPCPAGAPPTVPLNTHSPDSLNPYGSQLVYPVINPNPNIGTPYNDPVLETGPGIPRQFPESVVSTKSPELGVGGPSPTNQIRITHVRSLASDPQHQPQNLVPNSRPNDTLCKLLSGKEPIKMLLKRRAREAGQADHWDIELRNKIRRLGEETVKRELTHSPASPEPQPNHNLM